MISLVSLRNNTADSCAYAFHFESLPIGVFIHTVSFTLAASFDLDLSNTESEKKIVSREREKNNRSTVQIANVVSIKRLVRLMSEKGERERESELMKYFHRSASLSRSSGCL
jgi:hypothetical protein